MMQKNEIVKVKIEDIGVGGEGIGKVDGYTLFIKDAIIGDVVEAKVMKAKKNYGYARLMNVLTPSKDRVEEPVCPMARKCGGCQIQEMKYPAQLAFKEAKVRGNLERIGEVPTELLDKVMQPIVGMEEPFHYRNKAQYPVSICDGELFAGFYAYKSHRIICNDDCALQPKEFKAGLEAFRIWAEKANVTSYDENTGKGLLRHIYFRKGFATGEIMACAVINGTLIPESDLLVSLLREKIQGLKSVVININREKSNVILGKESKTVWGDDYIRDKLLGKTFVISPNSFYQVNHDQCERLYSKAMEYANLNKNETLLDLYCGVGTIGLTMAGSVKKLIGVEIVGKAIENAKINAKLNNIDNAEFICADAPTAAKKLEKADVIILDPPRKGCDASLFDTVCQMSPERIVYVSCDSSTLARDLKILDEKGYKTKRVCAVDMFPRTPHVEAVALIEKL
mgnify:CR=1 FL=1